MKARIINTPVEVEVQPYFIEGMFAGLTDVSRRLQPGMVVYKTSDLEFIDKPEPLKLIVDWDTFRREAAKDAMTGMMANADFWQQVWSHNRVNGRCDYPSEIAHFAIACADELIKALQNG